MTKDMTNNILKKTAPFIAIFALSLGVATYTFIQNSTRQAEAAIDGVNIELTNQSAPKVQKSTWRWRADLLASSHVGEKIETETIVSWCRETFGKAGESEGRICTSDLSPTEFISALKQEKKTITLQNSNFELVHPSVNCGRVYIEILGLDGVLGSEVYDAGVECKDTDIPTPTTTPEPQYGINDSQGNPISLSAIISDLFGIFGSLGSGGSAPGAPNPGGGTGTPGTTPGQNPPPITGYGSPPNRPYYNPSIAQGCYTSERFNEVYGASNPGQCWANTKRAVESSLTGINFIGKAIRVNRRAAGAFNRVDAELSSYRVSGSLYRFTQGEYRFSSVGTYNFRCNVNSSSSQNLCSDTCKLSAHAFGIAIDINPQTNANGSDNFDMPPEVVRAFENNGFRWGGRYKSVFGSKNDAMHFEYLEEVCQ